MDTPAAKVESVLDPTVAQLAAAYAEAVLDLLDDAQAEQTLATLAELLRLLDEEDGFEPLLISSPMTPRKREALVEKLFGGRLGEPLEGLLAVMARNGRMGLLRGVAASLRKQLDARQGKLEVSVTTACPLDEQLQGELQKMLRDALKAEPILKPRVDPSLVGGVVVRVGDKVFDASISSELARLRKTLSRRHSRGADEQSKDAR